MRILTPSSVLVTAAACSLLFPFTAWATPPGDNGTVKIHDAATGEELRKNEPHVCAFYLDAFGFDGGQEVDWHIEAWAPTAGVKGETVESGSLTLDGSGHGRTGDLTLPDGHYKLFWTFDGENGRAKQKVFWSACDAEPGGAEHGGSGTGGSEAGAGKPDTEEPGERPSSEASADAPAAPAAAAGASSAPAAPAPNGSAGGDLAETGSSAPVGVLAAIAAALVAGGAFLVSRLGRAKKQP
ncbi:hypothetical protein AMK26_27315 [Streptomyces sp. CB03234]|uniref:hypothetical protein n=1 Tax=Streptomyces sp. (strain CB03234) TaxID=1703937 RepID=UPI00093CD17C|nr:hypothetical protein [Streptomyces sp. CB03234]OKJ99711.1 hypothetical protein AMK26_27315 [Streptomyces sp. CB03234]